MELVTTTTTATLDKNRNSSFYYHNPTDYPACVNVHVDHSLLGLMHLQAPPLPYWIKSGTPQQIAHKMQQETEDLQNDLDMDEVVNVKFRDALVKANVYKRIGQNYDVIQEAADNFKEVIKKGMPEQQYDRWEKMLGNMKVDDQIRSKIISPVLSIAS